MKRLSHIIRLIHINFILARHGLDRVILSLHLFRPLRFLIYFNPWNWFRYKPYHRGKAIREALQDLGPIFVKFGQALSTRRDLFPDDIADELALLQDKVPPFPVQQAKDIVEKTYGRPIGELFQDFSMDVLASASIAQVHAATLFDGDKVVVKILRPRVKKDIQRDIALMYMIADLAEKYWPASKRFRPREVVEEFERTIIDELDLMREAASASQLRRHFSDSPLLYIPEIAWPYARENVLVMERIHGIPITDMDELKRHHINIKKLAERGVEIFFTQVFRDSFFHADMHPGNLFVVPDKPEEPQYLAVDFGIMGTLDEKDKRYVAENLHAFFHRDYHKVAVLHVESGWVPPNTRVSEFEAAIRTLCEPIFERPLKEISFAQLLIKLFQTGRRFNMEIQPQLILLQKTLVAVEGLGRQLYPELDLWSTAKPFLERWFKENFGTKAFADRLKHYIPIWAEQLPELPSLLHDVLSTVKQQQATFQQRKLEEARKTGKTTRRRLFAFGFGSAFILGAFLMMGSNLYLKESPLLQISYALLAVGTLSLVFGWANKK